MKLLTVLTAICLRVYCHGPSTDEVTRYLRHGHSTDSFGCVIPGLPWRLEKGGRTKYNCEDYSCACGGRVGRCSWVAYTLSPCQSDRGSSGLQLVPEIKPPPLLPNPFSHQQDSSGKLAISPLLSLSRRSYHGKSSNLFACTIPGLPWPVNNGGITLYNCKEYSCECGGFGECEWFVSHLSPCQASNTPTEFGSLQTNFQIPQNSHIINTKTTANHIPVGLHAPISDRTHVFGHSRFGSNIFGRYMNQISNPDRIGRLNRRIGLERLPLYDSLYRN